MIILVSNTMLATAGAKHSRRYRQLGRSDTNYRKTHAMIVNVIIWVVGTGALTGMKPRAYMNRLHQSH